MLFTVIVCVVIGVVCGASLKLVGDRIHKTPVNAFDLTTLTMFSLVGGLLLGSGCACLLAGFTGGSDCEYKVGKVYGTVVQVEVSGHIWETVEAKIQSGYESVSESVSVSGPQLASLHNMVGAVVAIEYVGCFWPDWRRGNSGNYVTAITLYEPNGGMEDTL